MDQPNSSILSSSFLSQLISQKLNHSNYLTWKRQIVSFIKSHRLYGHIDGTTPAPPQYIDLEVKRTVVADQGGGASTGSEIRFEYEIVTENNPAYEVWLAHDQSLVAYITSTVSEEVLGGVDDDLTALELWSTLATTYSQVSEARLLQLRRQFQDIKRGTRTVLEYLNEIKSVSDQLAATGHPVSDKDKVQQALSGLGTEFDIFCTTLEVLPILPSFEDLKAKLFQHEASRVQRQNLISSNNHNVLIIGTHAMQGHHTRPWTPQAGMGRGILPTPPGTNTTSSTPRRVPTCFYCNKRGHVKSECWHNPQNKNNHIRREGKAAAGAASPSSGQNVTSNILADAQQLLMTAISKLQLKQNERGKWYVDSGAAAHVTGDTGGERPQGTGVCCAWSVGSHLSNQGALGKAECLTLDFTQPRMSVLPLQRMKWIHTVMGHHGGCLSAVGRPWCARACVAPTGTVNSLKLMKCNVLADPRQQVDQMVSLTSYWGGFGSLVVSARHGCLAAVGSLLTARLLFFITRSLWISYSRSPAENRCLQFRTPTKVEKFLVDYETLTTTRYRYNDIMRMTSMFKCKLGQGGCGNVYKGWLTNGTPVAVKLMEKSYNDGEEFCNEVASIGMIHYVNVVCLLGLCVEGSQRALVYDLMENGSLEKFTDTTVAGRCFIYTKADLRIIHFDIKPHNILLDNDFKPKISDFGLAKSFCKERNSVTITEGKGPIGYVAPELFYGNSKHVSHKTDVYSFGMLLMAVIGMKEKFGPTDGASSEEYFPQWIHATLSKNQKI
ncbi:putative receptor-like protein kinase [Nymphaea thermarum]|nr:putative receptor-like protein kinase [Nymphaea thermarum]